jgi:hypothetical protein
MKKTLMLLSALLMVASVASAQQRGSLTLGFDDCRLAGGTSSKFFACNTNSGTAANTRNAVGCYVAGNGVDALVAWAGSVDIFLNDLTVAPWWQHGSAPACRGTDDLSVLFVGGFSCYDHQSNFAGGALGGQNYQYGAAAGQANHAQLRFVAAIDPTNPDVPIAPGTETYLYNALIRNGNTVAPNVVCAGCQIPVVMAFTRADLEQKDPDGPGGPLLPDNFSIVYRSAQEPSQPELAPGDAVVTWQTDQVFSDPTPTKNKTWGAIKSLYR